MNRRSFLSRCAGLACVGLTASASTKVVEVIHDVRLCDGRLSIEYRKVRVPAHADVDAREELDSYRLDLPDLASGEAAHVRERAWTTRGRRVVNRRTPLPEPILRVRPGEILHIPADHTVSACSPPFVKPVHLRPSPLRPVAPRPVVARKS